MATENNMIDEDNNEEFVYKILVVGDLGCGKTSFIHQYVSQTFNGAYRATIGVDFALKTLKVDKTNVRLQLWDIAGQERFGHMTRVYYKEALGAFVVYDVTRPKTFTAVTKWKQDIDENLTNIPCVLLANKCDLLDSQTQMKEEEMKEFCDKHNFIGWFKTSAKENINIDEAGKFLVDHILKNDPKAKQTEGEGQKGTVDLKTPTTGQAEKKSEGQSNSNCSC